MRSRKWFNRLGITILTGMMLVASGCGSSPVNQTDPGTANTSSPSSKDNPTVTVWMGSWWQDQVPKIVEAYKKDHPNVNLKIETMPINGYLDKAISTELGGNSPDVLAIDTLFLAAMAGKEMLEPWDDYVKDLDPHDFTKAIWDASFMNGKMYGLPYRGESNVFFYNKTLFDEAGVPYPKEDWTQEDMLEIAKKLTIPGKQYGVGIAAATSDPANVMTSFAPVLWSFNGDFFNKDNTEAAINNPEGVKAIQFWTELYTKYKVVPEGSTNFALTKDVQPLFVSNKVAMMPGSTSMLKLVQQHPEMNWGMQYAPDKFGRAGGWIWTIPKSAKNKEAGREFALWFVQPENLGALSSVTFPVRKSATNMAPWDSQDMQFLQSASQYQRSLPIVQNWSEMQAGIINELQKVLTGGKSPQDAADTMAKQMNELLKKQ